MGEVMTRDGGLDRVLLNAEGDRKLGPYLSEWQMRGVPIVREVAQRADEQVFFQERVPVRSHEFETALDRWGSTHDMMVLSIPDECLKTWEKMLRLPFADTERFSMFVTMRVASESDHAAWHDAVEAAMNAVETNDPSAKKKILDLRKKTAGDLMKKLQTA
jgi:hypothetical protein